MATITLTRDYGYDDYKAMNLNSTTIDASDASWIVSNMGSLVNKYPVTIDNCNNLTMFGGTINGKVSLTLDWQDAYVNSAALFLRDSDNVVVRDWTISRAWDGIRIRGSEGDNFTIDNVWLKDIRDDAIENDQGLSGTISNSFLDGVFVGISTADRNMSNQSDEVVTIDNVLIRMESYLYKGEVTHMSPFKVYTTSPRLKIYDTIIAIEDATHRGFDSLERAWDKVVDASGNYLLNLSDQPLPKNYPTPPEGFTILQGQAARDFYADASADWIADFNGTEAVDDDDPLDAGTVDSAAQQPGTSGSGTTSDDSTEDNTEVKGTASGEKLSGDGNGNTIYGYGGNDTLLGRSGDDMLLGGAGNDVLIGHEGDDILRGQAGDDRLVGRAGSDIMIGGTGADVFRISAPGESGTDDPDIIRAGDGAIAFEGIGVKGGDRLDLRGIDANTGSTGNQTFSFGSAGRGGVSLLDLDDGNTLVLGNTDGDDEFEFSVVIEDGDTAAEDYHQEDFLL